MPTGIGPFVCGYCGKPVVMGAVWHGATPYHLECTRGPSQQIAGGVAHLPLTEADVRRIAREEMDARSLPTGAPHND